MLKQLYQLTKNRIGASVLPVELIVFVTQRCPLRCAHCFIEEFQTDPQSDLPLDVIERLAAELPNLLVVMLTGGEPLLRNDLAEVVEAFSVRSRPRVISLTTSGWFPEKTEELVRKTLESNSFRSQLVVNISFDGIDDHHDFIRRRTGSYERALHTAGMLKGIRERDARLAVGANLTLVPQNQNTILADARALAETGLFSFLSHNMFRDGQPRSGFAGVDLSVYRKLSRLVQRYSQGFDMGGSRAIATLHRVKERYQSELIERTCATNEYQGLPCEAGRNVGVVYSDGSVKACELLRESWGNIKERSFGQIWNEAANRKRALHIRQSKCFCTHECFISASLNAQPAKLRHGLKRTRTADVVSA